jgi:hypothetical protein
MAGKPIHGSCNKCHHNPKADIRRKKHHIVCREMVPVNEHFESLDSRDNPMRCVRSICGRGDEVLGDALRFAGDHSLGEKWESSRTHKYKRMPDGSAYCESEGKKRRVFPNGKTYVMVKKGDISDLRNYAYVGRFNPEELAKAGAGGLEV